jgi:hypothetical protein
VKDSEQQDNKKDKNDLDYLLSLLDAAENNTDLNIDEAVKLARSNTMV